MFKQLGEPFTAGLDVQNGTVETYAMEVERVKRKRLVGKLPGNLSPVAEHGKQTMTKLLWPFSYQLNMRRGA